jgi:hypothetical protein
MVDDGLTADTVGASHKRNAAGRRNKARFVEHGDQISKESWRKEGACFYDASYSWVETMRPYTSLSAGGKHITDTSLFP